MDEAFYPKDNFFFLHVVAPTNWPDDCQTLKCSRGARLAHKKKGAERGVGSFGAAARSRGALVVMRRQNNVGGEG